jgi:hypothetical protein
LQHAYRPAQVLQESTNCGQARNLCGNVELLAM